MKAIGLLFLVLFCIRSFADIEKSIEERIQLIEEQRGYHFKKRHYHTIVCGEALYWKADVDGVAYAVTFKQEQNSLLDAFFTHYKTRTPHFSYDPGFRVGVGIQSPLDLFDVVSVWTRFHTTGEDKARGALVVSSPAVGDKLILDDIGLIQALTSVPNRASATCEIQSDLIDVQLARGIKVSDYFFMRPYFGVRGVWLDVDWRIKLSRPFLPGSAYDQDTTEMKIKNTFHAAGGLIGLDLDWTWMHGFGVCARGCGALVYGPSQEKTRQKYVLNPAGTDLFFKKSYQAKNATHTIKALWGFFAGFFWQTNFSQQREEKPFHKILLQLYAGYEVQQWPLLAQKTNNPLNRDRERYSLGLNGVTGGAKLVF